MFGDETQFFLDYMQSLLEVNENMVSQVCVFCRMPLWTFGNKYKCLQL